MPIATATDRRDYIDWARGLAVLLMIEAHTLDAWTRAADRGTTLFGYATILGGFAAPFFLWLAGVGVALSAARKAARTGSRAAAVRAVCERGLQIFVLAFLFRLQAFIISPGSHPVMIFRVDILNVMGPAMVAAALAWGLAESVNGRLVVLAVFAAAIALATPIVRSLDAIAALPTWVQWYLRPAGEFTTFTLFPWSGFVLAGAATGVLIDAGRDRGLHRTFVAAGLALVALAYAASMQPTIYAVPSSFWTSSPTWFAMRAGILMTAVSALELLGRWRASGTAWRAPLATLGRASLFVYWIHVELVYGYASWLWRHRLPLWGTALGATAFACLMYRAVIARNRYLAARAERFPQPASLSQA